MAKALMHKSVEIDPAEVFAAIREKWGAPDNATVRVYASEEGNVTGAEIIWPKERIDIENLEDHPQ